MSNVDSTQPAGEPAQAQYTEQAPAREIQISFWRRPFVLKIMPLLTSFAFHAGILLVAVVLIRTVPMIIEEVMQEQVIVPVGELTDSTDLGPIAEVSMDDITEQSMQDQDPTAMDAQGWSEQAASETPTLDSTPDIESNFTPIGQGLKVSGIKGDKSTGKQSRFGPPTGSKRGIFIQDSGKGGNARKIIYICDASGSIATGEGGLRQKMLLNELNKAIAALKPTQFFNVIFFSSGDPQVLSNGQLLQATPANRQKAFTFLSSVQMSQNTNPVPALKLAFRQDAELMFLLTDGEFDDTKEVMDTVRSLYGKANNTVISTIMLGNDDPKQQTTLAEIATLTGGVFKSVSTKDLIDSR